MKGVYLERVLEQIPRLLTQMDRREDSPTYGCFDRNFWHYRVTDFPCARHQEAAYTLALLYSLKAAKPYYNNARIRGWAEAGLRFWSRMQNSDGSFNEWYPLEHSFPATAFSTVSALEAGRLLSGSIGIGGAVKSACEWLIRHDEPLVANQDAAAILALRLAGYDVSDRLRSLLSRQTTEGWFSEYGGFDVGYSYVLLDCLARYWQITGEADVLDSVRRLLSFLSYFVHPDGTVGGCYTSRNTAYMIPSGLEMISGMLPLARSVADEGLRNLRASAIPWDDRYLCYQLHYHLVAYMRHVRNSTVPLPYMMETDSFFPLAGLHVKASANGDYEVAAADGRDLRYRGGVFLSANPGACVPDSLRSPLLLAAARPAQLVFGRSDTLAQALKRILRHRLIRGRSGKANIYVPSAGYYGKNDIL